MDDHILTGDGCRIHYRVDGIDGAPVVILSNSLGTDLTMWAPQLCALTARFKVLRYDTRGHGVSGAPVGSYGLDRLGRDVIELADALGITHFHFCGLSLGGMIGQWLGIHTPERVTRLVLANTSPFMGPPASWDQRIESVHEQGMAGLTASSIARWFTPEFIGERPDAVAAIEGRLLSTPPTGYAGCCAAIRDMDMRRSVSLIDCPTLVISGARDPATPIAHSEILMGQICGARLVTLDAAHLSNVERDDAFSEAVVEFLCG